MNVGGTHGVAVECAEDLSSRAVGGQRVGSRPQAVKVVITLLVGPEFTPQIVVDLVLGVLEVVFSVGGCLPDIDDSIWNSLSGLRVCHFTPCEGDQAAGGFAHDDAIAVLAPWSVRAPEGTEDGGGGGHLVLFGHDLVGHFIDEAK